LQSILFFAAAAVLIVCCYYTVRINRRPKHTIPDGVKLFCARCGYQVTGPTETLICPRCGEYLDVRVL